jgi:class 3 adenylate cyclase
VDRRFDRIVRAAVRGNQGLELVDPSPFQSRDHSHFVFVDVSDFSKMPAGIQLLVVLALVQVSRGAPPKLTQPEAALCIGDGYIYVFEDPVNATLFAADLANWIEMATATGAVPELHFRTGVHVGEVRCFSPAVLRNKRRAA